MLFILCSLEIDQSWHVILHYSQFLQLVTMLYDCIIDESTINSVLGNPTFLFEFKNFLVDPGVCSVMYVVS
jgi:hypothetical protein